MAAVLIALAVRTLTNEKLEVRTAKATYQDLVLTSSTNAKVEPIEDFPVYAQAPGLVQRIYVDVGEKVKVGQPLLKLDDVDARARLAQAQSNLQAAQSALADLNLGGTQDERNSLASDLSGAKLQRDQDASSLNALRLLQQKGSASPAEVSAAESRLAASDAKLHALGQRSTGRYSQTDRTSAEARLADARAAVTAAQSTVDNANIVSRVNGTVYSIPVTERDYVQAGGDLIYVADLNRMQITAYFDEPEIGNLAVGQPVTIEWAAKHGQVWHGHVEIAPASVVNYQSTRNVGECLITIDDAHGDLQPNANVTVYVTTAVHKHVLTVPHEAVRTNPQDTKNSYVYRVIGDKLVRTPVKVGLYNFVREEIVSGLSEGDVIATAATSVNRDLADGLAVTPLPPGQ